MEQITDREQKLPGFEDSHPPRPAYNTPGQQLKAAHKFAKAVVEWLGDPVIDKEFDRIVGECLEAIADLDWDGFALANYFKNELDWDGVDSNFVELADNVRTWISEAWDAEVEEWIRANDIKPKLKEGDSLDLPGEYFVANRANVEASMMFRSTIHGFTEKRGCYHIHNSLMGIKNGFFLIPYEKVDYLDPIKCGLIRAEELGVVTAQEML